MYVLHRLIRDLCQYFDLYRFFNVHSKAQVLILMGGCVALAAVLASGPVYRGFGLLAELPFRLAETVKRRENRP